jgi:hypothetical protein
MAGVAPNRLFFLSMPFKMVSPPQFLPPGNGRPEPGTKAMDDISEIHFPVLGGAGAKGEKISFA